MAGDNKFGVDEKWFKDRLLDQRKSTRGLARHLNIDPSSASRMLTGQRRMRMEEADAIARFLNVPVSEVLKHAGVNLEPIVHSRIVLAAIINARGEIERIREPKPLPQSVIDRAHAAIGSGNARVVAAHIRADKGPLAMWDDAVVLFDHTEIVDPGAIGVIAICRLREGQQVMVKIERARKTGEATVRGPDSSSREVQLDTATPVIAILP